MATLPKCHWLLECKLVVPTRRFLCCAGSFSALVHILSWVQNIELLSKEELFQTMTRAEKKGFALLLGERTNSLARSVMAVTWLPCHLHLAGTTHPLGSAFQPLWPSFHRLFSGATSQPQGLCPRHCLCLEGASLSSPYLPPASALLLTAQEIILCAS